MLRTIGGGIWLFFYFISRLPRHWKANRLAKKEKTQEYTDLVSETVDMWAVALLKHIKMQVDVTGRENLPKEGETVVFAANHQSFMDIPVVLANLDKPHGLMAKTELSKIPFLSTWMDHLGCVYVDRKDTRASITALKKAEQTVKDGNSFIVFPEGTRSQSDEMGEFKAGAMRMATKTGVPIVPVVIDGTWRALEGNGMRLKKAQVKLTILPQVETKGLSREKQKALPAAIEEMIRSAKK